MRKAFLTLFLFLFLCGTALAQDASTSGNITAPAQTVTLDLDSFGTTGLQVTGTWTGTLVFEATVDGTNYVAIQVIDVASGALVTDTTANGSFLAAVAGFQRIRVRASALASGTAVVTLRASPGGGQVATSAVTLGTVDANQGTPAATAGRWPVQVTDGTDLALVSGTGALSVTCDNCGGTSFLDNATFTFGTDSVMPIGAVVDDTATNAVTENNAGAPRMSGSRILYTALRNAAGTAVATPTAAPGASDVAIATRQVGVPAAAALAENTVNPTLTAQQVFPMVFDGANWDRLRGTGGTLNVNVTDTAFGYSAADFASGISAVTANTTGSAINTDQYTTTIVAVTCTLCGGGTTVEFKAAATGAFAPFRMRQIDGGTDSVLATETTATSYWYATVAHVDQLRFDVTNYSAGTVSVLVALTAAPMVPLDTPVVGTDGTALRMLKTDAAGELQVDVLTMPTVTVTDGAGALNVIVDSGAVTANAGTNLNTSALALEAGGNLAAAATSLGLLDNTVSGNELQVDVLTSALPTGAATAAIQTDGTQKTQIVDSGGAVVNATGTSLDVNCTGGCGGAAAFEDNDAFTFDTTTVAISGAVVDDVATNAVTENSAGAPRMSPNRNLHSEIRDAAGNERGANVTAGNALVVDGSAVTQPVSGTVTVTDGAGSLNVIVDSGTITAVTAISNALPAGNNNIGDVDVASLPALAAGNNNIGDVDVASIAAGNNNIGDVDVASIAAGDNNIGNVDVVTLPSVTIGTFPDNEPINVAQMNGVAVTMGNGASGTGVQRVTLANDSTGVIATVGAVTTITNAVTVSQGTAANLNATVVGTLANDGAAAATNRVGVLPAIAETTTLPTLTDGRNAALYVDTNGIQYVRHLDPCSGGATKLFLPINISTATTTEITAALAGVGNHYYVCSINIGPVAGAQNIALVDDDTDNCASVTSGLAGGTTAGSGWNMAANGGLTMGNGLGAVARTNGTNRVLCLVTSAAVQTSGVITVVAAP